MKIRRLIIPMLIFGLVLGGCANSTENKNNSEKAKEQSKTTANNKIKVDIDKLNEQFAQPKSGEITATINVKDFGSIKVKFFKDVAPKAVENFITHAKNGYYNGLTFHRIVNDFVIQGGDPKGDGTGGESIWNKPFEDEFPSIDNPIPFPYNGALAMANSGANTNGSQFFIVNASYKKSVEDQMKKAGYPDEMIELYKKHGGTPHLFLAHTVFGQVYEGMDIVGKIMQSQVGGESKVVIESIDVSE